MKKLQVVLVILFNPMAVFVVSGCETPQQKRARAEAEAQRAAELDRIECAPERRTKKLEPDVGGCDDPICAPFMLTTAAPSLSSSTTWGFAHSSGTSGCGKKSKKSSFYLQQQEFVAFTIDNLSEQIAQGGGPHLQSLAALLGCPASDYPALAGMTRRNFGRLIPSTEIEPGEFLARLKDDIARDSRLSVRCVYA